MDGKNTTSQLALSALAANAATLDREFEWFTSVINYRFATYFGTMETSFKQMPPAPDLSQDDSTYAHIVKHYPMTDWERIVLLLALCPHIKPWLLDIFYTKNASYDRVFTEFGGVKGFQHGGFLPTGETASFILAGKNTEMRLASLSIFDSNHFFAHHNILSLEHSKPNEPLLSGHLVISQEYLTYFSTGQPFKPVYSSEFPAQVLTTSLEMKDLVLNDDTRGNVEEILSWIENSDLIMEAWGLKNRLKAGFRSLFYGPPGTGKTLTAALLGKEAGLEVYRVDLSKVVSK